MKTENQKNQIIVVNGTPVEIEADGYAPIKLIMSAALLKAKYSNLPLENWEIKTNSGVIIDPSAPIDAALRFGDPQMPHVEKLWLSLKVGVGA